MEQRFKIGMRTIKTTIAVFLCMLIISFFPVENAFYACIASIVCMQQTLEHTIRVGLNRMKGTVVGALLGIGGLMLQQYTELNLVIVLAPLGVLLVLYLCNIMKMPASCSIGGLVYLSILLVQRDMPPYLFGMVRTLETFVGIVIAMLVNFCFDRTFVEKIRRFRRENGAKDT